MTPLFAAGLLVLALSVTMLALRAWIIGFRPNRCGFFGHRMEVLQHFATAQRLVCHQCRAQWVTPTHGEFAGYLFKWDADFADFYEMLGYPIRKWPKEGT